MGIFWNLLLYFLCAGIDYGFQTPIQAGFCEILVPYIRLLNKSDISNFINNFLYKL